MSQRDFTQTASCSARSHLSNVIPLLAQRMILANLGRRLQTSGHDLEELLDVILILYERREALPQFLYRAGGI